MAGLASLAPGATARYSTTFQVPAPAARGAAETDDAYLARLTALEGSALKASAAAAATGTSGPLSAAAAPVATTEHLPIVTIAKSGPPTVDAGATETNPLALKNAGGAAAAALAVTDSLPGGASGTVTGAPASLDAGAAAAAQATYPVPAGQPAGALTDTAAVTWKDANGNAYGPLSSAFTTTVVTALAGATLTLAPQTAVGVPGSAQTLQATLLDKAGKPIAQQAVTFTVTGANPTTGTATTDANGVATFSYTGANQGSDTVQATVGAGVSLQSNTASVSWLKPVAAVSTTPVQGRFFAIDSCSFAATPAVTPAFAQTFPTINFNPPDGTIPGNTSGVGVFTRPFTDITTDVAGNYTGAIVAQGKDAQGTLHQAGAADMYAFNAAFTGAMTVAQAGDVTFNFFSDDGFIFGMGGGATRVSGASINPPASGKTPFQNYPVMGDFNVPTSPVANNITVHFPAAGSYPYEVDYAECHGGQLAITVASGGKGVPPTGTITLSPATTTALNVGQAQPFAVAAMDAGGKALSGVAVTLNVAGANTQQFQATTDATGLATFTYSGANAGQDQVWATALVSGVPELSNTVPMTWNPAPPPPTITGLAPADESRITKPVPVTATITAPAGQSIASWKVTYQALDPEPAVTIASGSGAPPATLATFDPTLLANDTYALTVSASASGGGTQTATTTVAVAGNLKLGRFAVTYQDLSVPVNGFQMEVRRSYDSYDKRAGDFGVGWRVQLANFRLSANRQLGAGGWVEYPTQCTIGFCTWAFKAAAPRFVTVTFPDQHQEVFDFTPQGGAALLYFQGSAAFTPWNGLGITSTLEPLDKAITYNFDGTLRDSNGNIYNPTRFKLTTRDGRVLILDTTSGLVSETDRNGNSLTIDANGVHASNGQSITYSRDGAGRIAQITGPSGEKLGYAYSGANDLASFTDPNGNTVTYSYDASHDLLKANGPGGQPFQTLQYDSSGRLTAVTDANGNTTTVSNNVPAQQQTVVDPLGKLTTVYSYDDLGDVIRQDQAGDGATTTTTITYDAVGHPLSRTDPLGRVTGATYDAAGDMTSYTDPLNRTIRFAYDALGDETSATASNGTVLATSSFDNNGNLVQVQGSDGAKWNFAYDGAGHVISVTDPAGQVRGYAYDGNGHLARATDPAGNVTRVAADASGRLTSVTDAGGSAISYSYDGNGRVTAITDAAGHSRSFTYDFLGDQVSATDALGHTATAQYDGTGRLLRTIDRDGQAISYAYDADGRLVAQTLANGEATTYAYDARGRLVQLANATATLRYTYDAAGRVVAETTGGSGAVSLPSVTLSYAYDAADRRVSLNGPAGTTTYGYDALSRLTSLTDTAGGRFDLGYDAASRPIILSRPNGIIDTLTYTADGQLSSRKDTLASTALASFTYTYDAAGRRASLTDLSGANDYSYDAIGRLTGATHPSGGAEAYTYDAVGNRLSAANTPAGSLSYDAGDRLLADPSFTYAYDAEGRLVGKTERASGATTGFDWDARGQLVAIHYPDNTTTTYRYDPLGRRVEINAAGQVTRYVYDGDNIALEYDSTNTLAASYTHLLGLDQVLEMARGGQRYYYLQDGLGSVTALTDGTGTVIATYQYDAFGRPTAATGTVTNPFTYTSREYDAKSGLYYYRARYYDPTAGRFLGEDPAAAINPYTYADDNPVNHTDPSGALAVEYFALVNTMPEKDFDIDRKLSALNRCLGVSLVRMSQAMNEAAYPAAVAATVEPIGDLTKKAFDNLSGLGMGPAANFTLDVSQGRGSAAAQDIVDGVVSIHDMQEVFDATADRAAAPPASPSPTPPSGRTTLRTRARVVLLRAIGVVVQLGERQVLRADVALAHPATAVGGDPDVHAASSSPHRRPRRMCPGLCAGSVPTTRRQAVGPRLSEAPARRQVGGSGARPRASSPRSSRPMRSSWSKSSRSSWSP